MSGDVERRQLEAGRNDGTVVDLDRRSARPERSTIGSANRDDAIVDEEVASTISAIRHVAIVFGELQETIRRQEQLIDDQRQSLVDLQHRKQSALDALNDAQGHVAAERERADRAEHKVQIAAAQIRRLEDYCASLKSHLNSLIAAVGDSLAVPGVTPSSLEDRSA